MEPAIREFSAIETAPPSPQKPGYAVKLLDEKDKMKTFEQMEKEILELALAYFGPNPNLSSVARALGIGRSTLYRKISSLGISVPKHKYKY